MAHQARVDAEPVVVNTGWHKRAHSKNNFLKNVCERGHVKNMFKFLLVRQIIFEILQTTIKRRLS